MIACSFSFQNLEKNWKAVFKQDFEFSDNNNRDPRADPSRIRTEPLGAVPTGFGTWIPDKK